MTYQKDPAATLPDHADHLQNDARTCEPCDTPLAQLRSLGVLTKGFTYFVQDADMIKIGSSMRPKDRINALQTGSSRPFEVLAIVPMEIADEFGTHQKFAHLRERGEWFRAEPELLQFIERLKAPKPKPAPVDPLIRKLHKLRSAHGVESPVGYHCSNLTEIIPAYKAATDTVQRAYLAASARRQMAGLTRLRAGLQ